MTDSSTKTSPRYISATRMSGYAVIERSSHPDGEGEALWFELCVCQEIEQARSLAKFLSHHNAEGPDIG
jgi:hypothetical protein